MISLDKTKNLIQMLESPDTENQVMALATLNAIEPTENIVPLMLCYKLGIPQRKDWEENAGTAYGYMKAIFGHDDEGALRVKFKDMFTLIMNDKGASMEFVQYVFDYYGGVLTKLSRQGVHGQIKYITINVEPIKQEDEQSGDAS